MTTQLEADLTRAIASIVQAEKDLRSADAQFRIEVATAHNETSIERGITRDLVAAVHVRIDALENAQAARHRELLAAIAKLGVHRG